jgi:putative membrane protein
VELVFRLAGNLAALWVASELLDGMTYGDSFGVLVLAAAVFTVVNWLIKPVVTLLSLPLIILSLGVAYFFVNCLMLVVTDWVVGDFEAGSFWTVVAATVIVWAVNLIIGAAAHDWSKYGEKRRRRAARRRS